MELPTRGRPPLTDGTEVELRPMGDDDGERLVRFHSMHRVPEAAMVLEGAMGLTREPALIARLEEAVQMLDATVRHVRPVALELAADS